MVTSPLRLLGPSRFSNNSHLILCNVTTFYAIDSFDKVDEIVRR